MRRPSVGQAAVGNSAGCLMPGRASWRIRKSPRTPGRSGPPRRTSTKALPQRTRRPGSGGCGGRPNRTCRRRSSRSPSCRCPFSSMSLPLSRWRPGDRWPIWPAAAEVRVCGWPGRPARGSSASTSPPLLSSRPGGEPVPSACPNAPASTLRTWLPPASLTRASTQPCASTPFTSPRTYRALLARRSGSCGRGGRFLLTNWQPRTIGDERLRPAVRDLDWIRLLRDTGFADVAMEARPEWHESYERIYRTALEQGDPGDDSALADLQAEASARLEVAHLVQRVAVAARRP
jgi:hypothetical protein